MANPLLHYNPLGSAADIQHSVIGHNWAVNGAATYEECKPEFGNGVRLDAVTEYLSVADFTGLNKNVGCIEFWIKFLYASTDGTYYGIFRVGDGGAGNIRMQSFFNRDADLITFQITTNGFDICLYQTTVAITWAANEVVHIAYVWDKDAGLPGGKRGAIYWNGVEASEIAAARNGDWSASDWDVPNLFRLGVRNGLGGNQIFSNLKMWNYAKTDFSDRERKRAGLHDVIS